MAREIEVRFKLTDSQRRILDTWIHENAIFQFETHHIEYYLDNPNKTFIFTNRDGYKDSEHYLRVRFDVKKGDSVCLKVFEINQEKRTSVNLQEVEYSVSSGKEALTLFESLGYTDHILVDKTRKVFFTKDEQFEICLDEVKGLGAFVEVELKVDVSGDIRIGFHRIFDFLKSIGMSEIDEQKRGYVSMLWNPETNFGKIRKIE